MCGEHYHLELWGQCDVEGCERARHGVNVDQCRAHMPKPRCSEAECDRAAQRGGLCDHHYRLDRYGVCVVDGCDYPRHSKSTDRCQTHKEKPPCSEDGCDKPSKGAGLCSMHYSRDRGGSRPEAEYHRSGLTPKTVADRVETRETDVGWLYRLEMRDDDGTTYQKIGVTEVPRHLLTNRYGKKLVKVLDFFEMRLFDAVCLENALHVAKKSSPKLEKLLHFEPTKTYKGSTEAWTDCGARLTSIYFYTAIIHFIATASEREGKTVPELFEEFDPTYLKPAITSGLLDQESGLLSTMLWLRRQMETLQKSRALDRSCLSSLLVEGVRTCGRTTLAGDSLCLPCFAPFALTRLADAQNRTYKCEDEWDGQCHIVSDERNG